MLNSCHIYRKEWLQAILGNISVMMDKKFEENLKPIYTAIDLLNRQRTLEPVRAGGEIVEEVKKKHRVT